MAADSTPSLEVTFNSEWAAHMFCAAPVALAPAYALRVVHEDAPGDTKAGRCSFGGPLRLGNKVYTRGMGVNAHSVLHVTLDKPAKRLLADIGLDRNVDNTAASVRFHVAVNGNDVFATDVLRPTGEMKKIEVALNGAREFDLVVDVGGDTRSYDQADWGAARVEFDDGSTVWLDDLATQWGANAGFPFSFVYGGKASSELLPNWTREMHEEGSDATHRRQVLTLTDPATKLEVRAVCTAYLDTPGVDWTIFFCNKGDKDSEIIEQVRAVDVSIAPMMAGEAVLHRLKGSLCAVDDWLPFDEVVAPGKRVDFATTNGRSSNVCPFFNLDWGGGGVITGIGWSGQWNASVENANGALRVQAGMEHFRLKLHPGESIRTPRILQVYWFGKDPARSYNLWRQTMFAHVAPQMDGKPATPPIAHLSTSFYEMNDSTEKNVLAHLDAAKGLGFEVFWLDAYWTKDGFPNGMGHYGFPLERAVPADRFPNGLKTISAAAGREGMGFLMWFEPERVAANTAIANEHPDWVISPDNNGSGLFNLGIPEAREYMTKYLIAVVNEYGLAWLRIDYNIDPLAYWQFLNGKDPDRVGMAEIRYMEGLYKMWDDVRAAHPKLLIDNCASGGRRIDVETCSRSIPLWRTDATIDPLMKHDFNQAAIQNQVMTAGLSRYVPFSTSGQMGATPYLYRSGFNAGIAFCEDCRPQDYPKDALRQLIVESKRLRQYFTGNFYPLSDVTTSARDWCVTQYHRSAEQDGLVLAFRRHLSPYTSFGCELREIDPNAQYEVTVSTVALPLVPNPIRLNGAMLQQYQLTINERPGAAAMEYRRVVPPGK